MNIRPTLYITGLFLGILALSMIIPLTADFVAGSPDWKVFLTSMVITGFFSGALILSNTENDLNLTTRQSFLLITVSWTVIAVFGALPFKFSALNLSYTDAFFESMSGITTTGSTVITGLSEAPPGILLWRAILQWLGGIGIILMAMSILPFLNVGGMQIFRTELSENEKATPRVTQLASAIGLIYVALTLLCMILYMCVQVESFSALIHAMTTISTGGYSMYDSSFGHFETHGPEIVAIIFMIAGGIPFVMYLKAVRGNIGIFLKDEQVKGFLAVIGVSTLLLSFYLIMHEHYPINEAFIQACFNVVSIITGTGYVNGDYYTWGGFAVAMFFFLMVVGGCAGSTSCGIKIFRFQVLIAVTKIQIKKLLYPSAVFIPHYNKKPLSNHVTMAVMSFFFMYALCFSLMSIALSYTGLDFMTAMSGAATAISNVGPGLGDIIGPSGTFSPLNNTAKWILSAGMLLGRLEIFTVLVLVIPSFWKQ
jgi:trk system potassium uptake protein TrkH